MLRSAFAIPAAAEGTPRCVACAASSLTFVEDLTEHALPLAAGHHRGILGATDPSAVPRGYQLPPYRRSIDAALTRWMRSGSSASAPLKQALTTLFVLRSEENELEIVVVAVQVMPH